MQKFRSPNLKVYVTNIWNIFNIITFFQLDEFTMCLRFVIYQYPTEDQPFVFLRWFIETFASVGRYGKIYRGRMENDGVVYDNKNIVLKVVFSTLKLHQGWPPGMWQNLCIIYTKKDRNLQMVLNGEMIVDVKYDTFAENPNLDKNIRKGFKVFS